MENNEILRGKEGEDTHAAYRHFIPGLCPLYAGQSTPGVPGDLAGNDPFCLWLLYPWVNRIHSKVWQLPTGRVYVYHPSGPAELGLAPVGPFSPGRLYPFPPVEYDLVCHLRGWVCYFVHNQKMEAGPLCDSRVLSGSGRPSVVGLRPFAPFSSFQERSGAPGDPGAGKMGKFPPPDGYRGPMDGYFPFILFSLPDLPVNGNNFDFAKARPSAGGRHRLQHPLHLFRGPVRAGAGQYL